MRDRRGADRRDRAGAGGADAADRARAARRRSGPPPLSPAAVAELVRGSLGDDVGGRRLRRVRPDDGRQPAARAAAHHGAGGARRRARTSLDAGAIAAMGPPSVARFVAARLRRRSPAVAAVARALAILGDDASARGHRGGRGRRPRRRRRDAVDALIDAELLHPRAAAAVPPPDHPAGARRTRSRRPSGRSCISPPLASSRATRRAASARPPTSWPPAPARRALGVRRADGGGAPAGDRGSADHAVRFLRRALEEEAPAALRRSIAARARRRRGGGPHARGGRAHGGGAAPVERSGRARAAPRSASRMVRFLAAELPEAVAACEDDARDGGRARSRAAARARVPGGRHPPGRRAPQRRDVRAAARARAGGEPRRDGGGAQPARPDRAGLRGHHRPPARIEVAALAEAAWGDGRLLVEVRSQHAALAAPATMIALTAAPTAIALAGRLKRAIEVWSAGVEEGRARSSLLLYSSSPRPAGLRPRVDRRPRRRRGRRGRGAPAAARRRSDRPAERAVRARRRLHRARRARAGRGAGARRLADRRAAAVAEHQPGAGLARSARAADGRSGRRPGRSRGGRPARAGVLLREPVRADVAQLRGARRAPASASTSARATLVDEELEIGRRFGAPEPIGEALRVRALLVPGRGHGRGGPRGGRGPRRAPTSGWRMRGR